ncbi:hypothetical protein B0H11DRAFT_2281074 [Mycena galericulata]|nr:hypothetical protein B0H11DRAFT_2281074 [Mycena galericulata]
MSHTLPLPPSFSCAPDATTATLIELISALIRAITAFCIRAIPLILLDAALTLPTIFAPVFVTVTPVPGKSLLAATAPSASSTPLVAASASTPSRPVGSLSPLHPDTEKLRLAALERENNALRSELGIDSPDPDEIRIAEIERELASLRTASPSIASPTAPQPPSNSPSSTLSTSLYPPHHLSRPTYRLPLASNRPEDFPGYAPPRMRNVGLPPPPPPPSRRKISGPSLDTPFRSTPTPPPEDSTLAFASNPDTPFAITMRDLLLLAPDARAQILDAATNTPGIAYPVPRIPHLPVDAPTPNTLPPATILDKYYADFKRNLDSRLGRFSHRD